MKKIRVTILIFLILLVILSSCEEGAEEPPYGTDFPIDQTPAPTATPEIPEDFWQVKEVTGAQKIAVLSEYCNIPYDILCYLKGNTCSLFLPETVDLSTIVLGVYDKSDNLIGVYASDFSRQDGRGIKNITLNGKNYNIVAVQGNCPAMFINIDEQYGTLKKMYADVNHETFTYGDCTVICSDATAGKYGYMTKYVSAESDTEEYCTVSLRGRGNWTWSNTAADKKGYRIKFETKIDLLGMGHAKKWALVANIVDNTLIRNTVAFDLARSVGFDYVPESRNVDLYINGEYLGLYQLFETVEIDTERINIADLEKETEKLASKDGKGNYDYGKQRSKTLDNKAQIKYWTGVQNPEDITGGYIVELEFRDRYLTESSGFITSRNNHFVIKSPEYVSMEQAEYVATLFQKAEDAIYDGSGKYTDYIDLDSLIKVFLLNEAVKSLDGAYSSFYFYKPSDSQSKQIYAGPIWDFDGSLGNTSEAGSPEAWLTGGRMWFSRLRKDERFMSKASEIWNNSFLPAINKLIDKKMDEFFNEIDASREMNYLRWSRHLTFRFGKYDMYPKTGRTPDEGLTYIKNFLQKSKTWLTQRLN